MSNVIENFPILKVESKKILLREIRPTDVDSFLEYRSNPKFIDPPNFSPVREMKKAKLEIARLIYEFYSEYAISWGIVEIENQNKLIGIIRLISMERRIGDKYFFITNKQLEISTQISPEYQSSGLGTSVKKKVIQWAFNNLKNLNRIQSEVYNENRSSKRTNEKIGFVLEGKFREAVSKYNSKLEKYEHFDLEIYSFLRNDFKDCIWKDDII